ncbi:MAG: zf-TFIIB domain-containing protein [Candidatus Binatia bacterium]
MADTERDRFREKLRDKQKGTEDTFFGRRDRELLEKMREERRRQAAAGPMKCPRCQAHLVERIEHDVTVDECSNCGGIWLDKGELEQVAHREQEGWFGRLLRDRLGGGS